MTRRKPALLLFIFLQLFVVTGIHAQLFSSDLQKGFKAYDNNNYDKALELFNGLVASDSSGVGANFGISEVYFSRDYSGYSPEKAYQHIVIAQTNFDHLSKKQLASLVKMNIDKQKIDQLRAKIDDELFNITVTKNTTQGFDEFISRYPNNANIEQAKELRGQLALYNASSGNSEKAINDFINSNPNGKDVKKAVHIRNMVAFQNAKAANTIEALKEFIEKYPDADEVVDARAALASLEFANAKRLNTIAAYDSFLVKYPDAEEYMEATLQRNQLAYIQVLEQQKMQDSAELLRKQSAIDSQSLRINLAIASIIVMLLLGGLLLRGYRIKKRANVEITMQKEIIEQKNKEIVDSINYAKKIQDSMLPSLSEIKRHFPETFIFYRPRNIVSGDFYWFAKKDELQFIAAVDCTGHGVPGAMLSMMGFNFLDQIVNEMSITDPGKILDQMHLMISHSLNKEGDLVPREIRDGMDIALLCINHKNHSISFSGAVRPLYYVDEEGIKAIKGGYYSIGGIKSLTEEFFTTLTVTPKGKATFYLFSDGFADQFGGPKGKKFKLKNFQELLLAIQDKSMEEQQKSIESSFISWMGNNEQVDDVCVIGVRI